MAENPYQSPRAEEFDEPRERKTADQPSQVVREARALLIAVMVFVSTLPIILCGVSQSIMYVVTPGDDERVLYGTLGPMILVSLLLALLPSTAAYRWSARRKVG